MSLRWPCRESAVPIFTVALQCNVSLQLLDVPSNVAIISRSPADEANGNLTLATYRYAQMSCSVKASCSVAFHVLVFFINTHICASLALLLVMTVPVPGHLLTSLQVSGFHEPFGHQVQSA